MRRVSSQIAAACRDSSINKITLFRERYFVYSRISQKTRIVFVVNLVVLKVQTGAYL